MLTTGMILQDMHNQERNRDEDLMNNIYFSNPRTFGKYFTLLYIMSDNTDLDLLDVQLDDIEDLAGFEVPSAGEYVLRLSAEIKDVSDKKCLEIGYEVMECLKKNNDTDPDAIPGTKFSQLFGLQGEEEKVKKALQFAKKLLAGVAEQVGEGNLAVLVRDHLPGMVVEATVKRRQDKEDKERFYAAISNMRKA